MMKLRQARMADRDDNDELIRRLCTKEPISKEAEYALADRIAAGDTSAADLLVEHNMRFIIKCASSVSGISLDFEDAISAAYCGAITASRRYEAGHGRFIAYAIWYIHRELLNQTLEITRPVRLPRSFMIDTKRLRGIYDSMMGMGGIRPSINQFAEAAGISIASATAFVAIHVSHDSLDQEIEWHGGGEKTRLDFVVCPGAQPDEAIIIESDMAAVMPVIDRVLTEREREILFLRNGIGTESGEPMLLDGIGATYGISRERSRQIYCEALWKVAHELGYGDKVVPTAFLKERKLYKERAKRYGKASYNPII